MSPWPGQRPCIQIVSAIRPLQAAHIEMRYLDLGQNLCTLLFIVIIIVMINVFSSRCMLIDLCLPPVFAL